MRKNRGPLPLKQGLTINWECLLKDCYYRMVTVEGDIKGEFESHNHHPTLDRFVKREARVKLKKAVASSGGASTALVSGPFQI